MCFKVVAGATGLVPGYTGGQPAQCLRVPYKAVGYAHQEIVDEKLVELAIEIGQCAKQDVGKNRIADNGLSTKGSPSFSASRHSASSAGSR